MHKIFKIKVQGCCTLLNVDMPILTCIYFTLNWLTLISEMHFVKFHPEVASCLLSRGKRKYAPLGMRLLWKYIRNYFLVYHLISHFLLYLQNYKEFEAEILDLQSEKYGLSFDIKKIYYFQLSLARYNWPHSFSCAARCGKHQISCHNKRYIQSRPRTGEVQTRHEYWHLYVTMLWL